MSKPRKVRFSFRKNREARARQNDLTRDFSAADSGLEDIAKSERVSGKGELTRKRTLVFAEDGQPRPESPAGDLHRNRKLRDFLSGRVLRVMGLWCDVQTEDGRVVRCATRRLLKTLQTDERHVVAVGDKVAVRLSGELEGMIERVDPRHGILARTSRGRRHIIATNIDQVIVVTSAAEPRLKPGLIDRYLVTIEKEHMLPVICITKIDLVAPADLMPLVGVFAQLGYPVLLLSNATGQGIDALRWRLKGRTSVVAGQSGVGKSSLLNCIDPSLNLSVGVVSESTEKGKHTTTTAILRPLNGGGYVVDTPGIRQFELWNVTAREVASCFRDIHPFEHRCRFPDCTHMHEQDCAVKNGVADGLIDLRRYESYCHLVLEG